MEEIKNDEVKIRKVRSNKSYYVCKTCSNKFNTMKDLNRHLLRIKGCFFLSNTEDAVKNLMTKYITSLDTNLESLKLDITTLNTHNRVRRLKTLKDTYFTIKRLYNNQIHLYDKNDAILLKEFIDDYEKELLSLIGIHNNLSNKVTLDDI